MTLTEGGYRVELTEMGARWLVHDLEGSGNAADLAVLIRRVRKMTPLLLHVDEGNPLRDRLLKLYKRLGAKRRAIWLEIN